MAEMLEGVGDQKFQKKNFCCGLFAFAGKKRLRNRFKNDQGALWLTIPVWKKGLGDQQISKVRICYEGRWQRKHLESLKSAYGNAPYLGDHLRFLEELFAARFDKLIDLNLAIIRYLLDCLQIPKRLVLLSELGVTARGTQLLIEICQAMGDTSFLAQSQARIQRFSSKKVSNCAPSDMSHPFIRSYGESSWPTFPLLIWF